MMGVLFKHITRFFTQFFTVSEQPHVLRIFRIALSIILALHVFLMLADFKYLFGGSFWAALACAGVLLSSVSLALNIQPGLSSFVSFLLLALLFKSDPHMVYGGSLVLQVLLFFSTWLPFSKEDSVLTDRFLPGWPVRILQLHCVFAYLGAALAKWKSGFWVSGRAIELISNSQHSALSGFQPFLTHEVCILLTYGVLLIEFLVPFMFFVRPLRRWAFVLVLLLNLGISLSVHVTFFGEAMTLSAFLWLKDEDLKKIKAQFRDLLKRFSVLIVELRSSFMGIRLSEALKRSDLRLSGIAVGLYVCLSLISTYGHFDVFPIAHWNLYNSDKTPVAPYDLRITNPMGQHLFVHAQHSTVPINKMRGIERSLPYLQSLNEKHVFFDLIKTYVTPRIEKIDLVQLSGPADSVAEGLFTPEKWQTIRTLYEGKP